VNLGWQVVRVEGDLGFVDYVSDTEGIPLLPDCYYSRIQQETFYVGRPQRCPLSEEVVYTLRHDPQTADDAAFLLGNPRLPSLNCMSKRTQLATASGVLDLVGLEDAMAGCGAAVGSSPAEAHGQLVAGDRAHDLADRDAGEVEELKVGRRHRRAECQGERLPGRQTRV
jgi:hypothetical protein